MRAAIVVIILLILVLVIGVTAYFLTTSSTPTATSRPPATPSVTTPPPEQPINSTSTTTANPAPAAPPSAPQPVSLAQTVPKSGNWTLYNVGNGYTAPIRLNENGDIECMSSNGWDCYWSTNISDTNSNINNPPLDATKPNICNIDGYSNKEHWCYKGMIQLNPLSSKIKVTDTVNSPSSYIRYVRNNRNYLY